MVCSFVVINDGNFIIAMSVVTVVEPPMIVPNSISPTGEILTNQGIWSVQFNKKV